MHHHNTRSDGKSIDRPARPQPGAWVRAGFTLVELLAVIAIIVILVAILLPAAQRVRASARSTQSKNNLSEMGVAMKHYEGLGRGNLRTANWEQTLAPFVDDAAAIFVDPSDDDGDVSYALSSKVVLMGANDDKKIAIVESDVRVIDLDTENCTGGNATITGDYAVRHLGSTNALLYGGAVRTFEPADIDLADTSKEPLVIWWLPDREHGLVCGTVVVIDNPNPLPTPSGTDSDPTLNPDGSEPPEEPFVCGGKQLVAHWSFDDPDDVSFDDTGNGYDGIAYGGAVVVDDAERGKVLELDGINDWIHIDGKLFDLTSDCYTFSAWFKHTAIDGTADDILNFSTGSTHGALLGLDEFNTVGRMRFLHRFEYGTSTALGTNIFYDATALSDGGWHQVVAVKDGDEMRLVVDGNEVGTNVDTTRFEGLLIGIIGRLSTTSSARYFNGQLDDVKIYSDSSSGP